MKKLTNLGEKTRVEDAECDKLTMLTMHKNDNFN
jgi:hypothetical protein